MSNTTPPNYYMFTTQTCVQLKWYDPYYSSLTNKKIIPYFNILSSGIHDNTPTDSLLQLSIAYLMFLCRLPYLIAFSRSLISRSPFRFINIYVFLILCISALDASDDPREDIDASFPWSKLEKNSASFMCLCTWSSKTLIMSSWSLLTVAAPVLDINNQTLTLRSFRTNNLFQEAAYFSLAYKHFKKI